MYCTLYNFDTTLHTVQYLLLIWWWDGTKKVKYLIASRTAVCYIIVNTNVKFEDPVKCNMIIVYLILKRGEHFSKE